LRWLPIWYDCTRSQKLPKR